MKKKYTEVDMEVIEFETEDVITTSDETSNDETDEHILDGGRDTL